MSKCFLLDLVGSGLVVGQPLKELEVFSFSIEHQMGLKSINESLLGVK
jgi:hypothetical protein